MTGDGTELVEDLRSTQKRFREAVKAIGYQAMTDRLGSPNEQDVINEVDSILATLDSAAPHIDKVEELLLNK